MAVHGQLHEDYTTNPPTHVQVFMRLFQLLFTVKNALSLLMHIFSAEVLFRQLEMVLGYNGDIVYTLISRSNQFKTSNFG